MGIIDFLLGLDKLTVDRGSEWRLIWRSSPEAWVIVLVLIPMAYVIPYLIYKKEGKGIGGPKRFALALLRSASILLLLAMLFQPTLLLETEKIRKPYLIMLFDDSMSLTLSDNYPAGKDKDKLISLAGQPQFTVQQIDAAKRIDIVNRVFSNPELALIQKLNEKNIVKAYSFTDSITPESAIGSLKAQGSSTAIGDAISSSMKDLRGQAVAGIVLVSDGRSNGGIEIREALTGLFDGSSAIPVFCVAAGNAVAPKDIQMMSLSAPEVAVVKDVVNFEVIIRQHGFGPEPAEIVVKENTKVVSTKSVVLSQDDQDLYVTLSYTPEAAGDFEISIEIPPREGELLTTNNSIKHPIQVRDDRIKVLFVEGYPRWEYQYLKTALLRDRSIKVQCLLLSADPEFPQESSTDLPPLTSFPPDRKSLFEYDVIIFGDVEPVMLASSNTPSHEELMRNIEEFVELIGGGFLMISGKRNSPRSYRNTSISKILPIMVYGDEDDTTLGEPFKPRITPEGASHPVMLLEQDPAVNKKLWEDPVDGLPGMYWYYSVKKVKPVARVLAELPSATGENTPLIAVQQYRRGRTMFVGFDSTWRWRQFIGDKYFYRFWSESIRFLRGGRLSPNKRFQLATDKPDYSLGDKVTIYSRIFDEDFKPWDFPSATVSLELPDGVKKEIELALDKTEPGSYVGTFQPDRVGMHRFVLGTDDPVSVQEGVSKSVMVNWPTREFDEPIVDRQTLEMISSRTGGKFFHMHEVDLLPDAVKDSRQVREYLSQERSLWDTPLAFLVFLLVISVEWVVRKALKLI